jgi:hypothetical protein
MFKFMIMLSSCYYMMGDLVSIAETRNLDEGRFASAKDINLSSPPQKSLLTLQLQLDWKKGGGWREVLHSHEGLCTAKEWVRVFEV